MEESESGQNWLKNQVKVVCEREILASLVELKHHSMAETIRNEKEEKKTKAKAPGLISAPPRQPLRRYGI